MRLTRRDAIVALSAVGVGGGFWWSEQRSSPAIGESELATLTATAEVLYPSELTGIDQFVERYVRGQGEDAQAIADAVASLDSYTESWHDQQFDALDPRSREKVLQSMGADTASPNPEGSDVERVRYHVVNELLFALYATPTGGELLGIENPPGHPGGIGSYQWGPNG